MSKGEFTNKHITEKFDHLILDSSLSDDFYWGSSGTIEVSVGAIPGGVTQSQLNAAIAKADASISRIDTSVGALDTLTQNLDTSLGAFGQNITVSPSENASYNNGSYMCVDSSLYFKANDFWLVIDASLMF